MRHLAFFCSVFVLLLSCRLVTAATVLEETIERTYTIDPRSTLEIRNTDGSIQIYGSDDNELKIEATKRSYSAARLRKITVHVAVRPGNVLIWTAYPPPPRSFFSDRSGTVDYIIELPQTCRLASVELAAGEVLIEGMRGAGVEARLKNGRLLVHNCFANLHLMMDNGGLQLGYDWWENQASSVQAELGNAKADLFLPADGSFQVLAESKDGQVITDFAETHHREGAERKAIDLVIGGSPRTVINIRAGAGNIGIAKTYP